MPDLQDAFARIQTLEDQNKHTAKWQDDMATDVKAIRSRLDNLNGGLKVLAVLGGAAAAILGKFIYAVTTGGWHQ